MRNILVATDFTGKSDEAIGRACALARDSGAALHVLHSAPPLASEIDALTIRSQLRARLAHGPGAPPQVTIEAPIRRDGERSSEAILACADRLQPDLIVLGDHGEPRLRDAIFGATAAHVVRHASAPVLIAQTDHRQPYECVMVAVDESLAEPVLQAAIDLPCARDLFVVHAFEWGEMPPAEPLEGTVMEDVRTGQDALTSRVKALLGHADGRLAAVRLHQYAREGEVMDVLMFAWEELRPDLVVMGTHGRTGVSRLLHGSYAETALLGCPSDLLIVRSGADEAQG